MASTYSIHIRIMKDYCVFLNIEIVMRIFLSTTITNPNDERLFSELKLVKNELRNCMTQLPLNNLSLMSIENEILLTINFEIIINNFLNLKCRNLFF